MPESIKRGTQISLKILRCIKYGVNNGNERMIVCKGPYFKAQTERLVKIVLNPRKSSA